MGLLHGSDQAHGGGDLREAFLFGYIGEFLLHFGPFIVFTGRCILQIFGGGGNAAVVQELEPNFCMLLFVVGGFLKNSRDLLISILLSADA